MPCSIPVLGIITHTTVSCGLELHLSHHAHSDTSCTTVTSYDHCHNMHNLCCVPTRLTTFPIKGEVEGIERGPGRTEVLVDEGLNVVSYALDEALIDFGAALEALVRWRHDQIALCCHQVQAELTAMHSCSLPLCCCCCLQAHNMGLNCWLYKSLEAWHSDWCLVLPNHGARILSVPLQHWNHYHSHLRQKHSGASWQQ